MIRIDSLLVRALAAALDTRYRGQAVRGLRLDPATRTAIFAFPGEALVFMLDPARPSVQRIPGRPKRTDSALPSQLRVRSVRALPDERIIEWAFEAEHADPPVALVEWLTNRLNALVVGPDGNIRAVLAPRDGERRALTAGSQYELPPGTHRLGIERPVERERFAHILQAIAPAEREKELVRTIAFTSPLNARAILGPAGSIATDAAIEEAYDRYVQVVWADRDAACTFDGRDGPQPYPVRLPGVRCTPAPDLLGAFAAATEDTPVDRVQPVLERVRRERTRVEARIRRLREEAAGATSEAETLRKHAGLLLSQPHAAPRGMKEIDISDFQGGTVRIALDPSLGPADNAERLFDAARKRDRAADRLPRVIVRAEREAERMADVEAKLIAGEIDPETVFPETQSQAASPQVRALPYKRFRTSGGLEVRVGRGARKNDDLTFHHSRPDDIWMHARDVGGAHVVLRWESRESNPPASDLREAAILAALHSKARTSGVVPVDWTRRKYVRKPRRSPPGTVTVERVKTLFVEPDAALAERLQFGES